MGRHNSGYTLIELIVAVLITGTLLAMAVPSMVSSITGNRMTSTTNSLVSALSLARSESIKRKYPVTVCASEDGASCSSNGWGKGWIVFVDGSQPGSVEPDDILLLVGEALDNGQSLSLDGTPYIQFQPSGMIVANCQTCATSAVPVLANAGKKSGAGINKLFALFSPIGTTYASSFNRYDNGNRYSNKDRDNGCRGNGHYYRSHDRHDCTNDGDDDQHNNGRDNDQHDGSRDNDDHDQDDQGRDNPGANDTDDHGQNDNSKDNNDNRSSNDDGSSHQDTNDDNASNENNNDSAEQDADNQNDDDTAGNEGAGNEQSNDNNSQGNEGSGQNNQTSNNASEGAGSNNTPAMPGKPTSSGASSSPRSFKLCNTSNPSQPGRAIDISLGGRVSIRPVDCQQ